MRHLLPAAALLPATLLLSLPAHACTGDVLMDATFDNLPLGPAPLSGAPYAPVYQFAGTATIDDEGGGDHRLTYHDGHSLIPGSVRFDFPETTTGMLCISFTVTLPAYERFYINVLENMGLSQKYFHAQFIEDQMNFQDANSTVYYVTTMPPAGTPMDFVLEFDMDAGTYDVWVDDVLVVDDQDHGITSPGIGRLAIGDAIGDFDIDGEIHFDDFRVQRGGGAPTDTPVVAGTGVGGMRLAASPNPLRSDTTVRFELPQEGPVALEVYDARGRRVRELWDGHRTAGTHTVRWDGLSTAGRRVPAGVYFLRVNTAEGGTSRKLTVIR
ncbi:T9SS type A sorting domain-containing protein [bacterium]|nr:T9SS type A sorting domain-containing protein [bacterium]